MASEIKPRAIEICRQRAKRISRSFERRSAKTAAARLRGGADGGGGSG